MEKNKQAEILRRVLELEKQIVNTNCALERLLVEQYTSAPIPPNLLKYCELDTYAMVKVWEELVRVAQDMSN